MPFSSLLSQRYGAAEHAFSHAPVPSAAAPVIETLLAHRSVRHFLADALPAGTLELLIAAAQSAPSSSNLQLWSVVAVEQQDGKQRLSKIVGDQAHVRDAPLFLAWLVDVSRVRRLGEDIGTPAEGAEYFDAFLTGAIDASLAAQNVLVAAEALGLGTVYIGALRNHPDLVRDELGLEHGAFPLFGLCIGKPDPAVQAAVKPRLAQPAVLHRERYVRRPIAEELGGYDDIMKGFYASQKMPVVNWSQQLVDRLRNAASLKGRDRLRDKLAEQGFELR